MAKKAKEEMLVVASKCKAWLRDRHELRCSADALEVLSAKVRQLLNLAAQKAEAEHRQTVKDRDIEL